MNETNVNLEWNNVGAQERYDDEREYEELRLKASLQPKSISEQWQEHLERVGHEK